MTARNTPGRAGAGGRHNCPTPEATNSRRDDFSFVMPRLKVL